MINLGSCIEMMFCEFPFIDRIGKAAAAGFSAVEFWNWAGKDMGAIKEASEKAGIPVAVCLVGTLDAARAGQYAKGKMLAKENARIYAEMVEETMQAARPLGIRTLIATTGQALEGVDRQKQQEAVVECLHAAVPALEKGGFTIVLEPLNTLVDHKGYYLDTSKQALEILRQVGSPNVKLLYDVYHMQLMEGNLINAISENVDMIGHIHIADVPGRHEPGSGEINYKNLFQAISASGYAGYVGCEYGPTKGHSTAESAKEALSFAAAFGGKCMH